MRSTRANGQLTLVQNAMLEVFLLESVYAFYIGRSTIILVYRLVWLVHILRSRLVLFESRSGDEADGRISTACPSDGNANANAGGAPRDESYGSTGAHARRGRDGAHEGRVREVETGGARDPVRRPPPPALQQDSGGGGAPEPSLFDAEGVSQEEFSALSSRHSVLILLLAICFDVFIPVFMRGWHPLIDAPPTCDFSALNSMMGSYGKDGWGRGIRESLSVSKEAVSDVKASELFAREYYYSKTFTLYTAIMDFMAAVEATPRIPLFILLLDIFIFFIQRICIELFFSRKCYAVLTTSPAGPRAPPQGEQDRKQEGRSRRRAEGCSSEGAGGLDETSPLDVCTVRRGEVPNSAAFATGLNESPATLHDPRKRAKGQRTACKYMRIPTHEDDAKRNLTGKVDPGVELAELGVNVNDSGAQADGSSSAGSFESEEDAIVAVKIVVPAVSRDGGRGAQANEPPTQDTPTCQRDVGKGKSAGRVHQSIPRASLPSQGDREEDVCAGVQFGETITDPKRVLWRLPLSARFRRILPGKTVIMNCFQWLFTGWQKEFISIAFEEERCNELR